MSLVCRPAFSEWKSSVMIIKSCLRILKIHDCIKLLWDYRADNCQPSNLLNSYIVYNPQGYSHNLTIWLVLTYDLLEDRPKTDVLKWGKFVNLDKNFLPGWANIRYMYQKVFLRHWTGTRSRTHSADTSCATLWFLPHSDVICDLLHVLLNRPTASIC